MGKKKDAETRPGVFVNEPSRLTFYFAGYFAGAGAAEAVLVGGLFSMVQ